MSKFFKVNVDTKEADKYLIAVRNRARSGVPSWKAIKLFFDNMTERTFLRNSGNEFRNLKWLPIKETMYGKIRRGTDGTKKKRFDSSSKPLFSSGGFMRSFNAISQTKFTFRYGSGFDAKLAKNIQRAGQGKKRTRHVLPPAKGLRFLLAIKKEAAKFMKYIMKGK